MGRPLLLFITILLQATTSAPVHHHPDRTSLPGAPLLPQFNLFSGYLNGSSSATSAPIFYVLAEAIRVDPSTAPLVLWFNGGPGGSSLHGFFEEHGPYRVTENGDVLMYNEFSWNQYANVLYLESPLGVGFSRNDEGDLTTNDMDAAEVNFNALRDFMTKVHPNYADRAYYLSGQSYAGAYVPFLSSRLLIGIEKEEMRNRNFKGFAIGNPVFDSTVLYLAAIHQYLSYGLIPVEFAQNVSEQLIQYEKGVKLNDEEIDALTYEYFEATMKFGANGPVNYNFIEHCYSNNRSREEYHVPSGKNAFACYGGLSVEAYLNRADVQIAMHAVNISGETIGWTPINFNLSAAYNRSAILPVYDDIFRMVNGSSFRVLIYHGDTDLKLPPFNSLYNVGKIAKANSLVNLQYARSWKVYDDFAGVRIGYKKGNTTMDVLTVRGAGHSVPTDLPAQAFQMINNFLSTADNEKIDYSQPIRKH